MENHHFNSVFLETEIRDLCHSNSKWTLLQAFIWRFLRKPLEVLTLGPLLLRCLVSEQWPFLPSEGAAYKSRTSCLQDLFGHWVMPTEAWPVLNQMAVGQQIPAGLHCIIQLFWTRAPAVSELAAAIELLLPPICTQSIERLLQPCPRCLSSILPWANWPHWASPAFRLYIKPDESGCGEIWQNTCNTTFNGRDKGLSCVECAKFSV